MTVCIAASCSERFIIAAADRMLTTGDIQYEPPVPKAYALTSSIYILSSGDASLQREIINRLSVTVGKRISERPEEWLNVDDVTWLYVDHYAEARLRRAEAAILRPLGLDRLSFTSNQGFMNSELVLQLSRDLINYAVPQIDCIITGIDNTGAHIFTVYDGQVACNDAIGFACIGSGAAHASSQFMLAKHGPNQPATDTLVVTYNAKKRSEIAPGVGSHTDLYVIGPALGTSSAVHQSLNEELAEQYAQLIAAEEKAAHEVRTKITEYIVGLTSRTPSDQAAAEPDESGDAVERPG